MIRNILATLAVIVTSGILMLLSLGDTDTLDVSRDLILSSAMPESEGIQVEGSDVTVGASEEIDILRTYLSPYDSLLSAGVDSVTASGGSIDVSAPGLYLLDHRDAQEGYTISGDGYSIQSTNLGLIAIDSRTSDIQIYTLSQVINVVTPELTITLLPGSRLTFDPYSIQPLDSLESLISAQTIQIDYIHPGSDEIREYFVLPEDEESLVSVGLTLLDRETDTKTRTPDQATPISIQELEKIQEDYEAALDHPLLINGHKLEVGQTALLSQKLTLCLMGDSACDASVVRDIRDLRDALGDEGQWDIEMTIHNAYTGAELQSLHDRGRSLATDHPLTLLVSQLGLAGSSIVDHPLNKLYRRYIFDQLRGADEALGDLESGLLEYFADSESQSYTDWYFVRQYFAGKNEISPVSIQLLGQLLDTGNTLIGGGSITPDGISAISTEYAQILTELQTSIEETYFTRARSGRGYVYSLLPEYTSDDGESQIDIVRQYSDLYDQVRSTYNLLFKQADEETAEKIDKDPAIWRIIGKMRAFSCILSNPTEYKKDANTCFIKTSALWTGSVKKLLWNSQQPSSS